MEASGSKRRWGGPILKESFAASKGRRFKAVRCKTQSGGRRRRNAPEFAEDCLSIFSSLL
jgi:hypothetical protein